MTVLNMKKLLVVASFGVILFVASFMASSKMNAYELFCGATNALWFDMAGAPQCGAAAAVGDLPKGQLMTASYYGFALAGNPTASGEPFNPMEYTAAHKTMPFGTKLLVSRAGNSVVVTVNDRGPYADGRDLDLSEAAADTIGLTGPGVAPVEVTAL